MNHYTYLLEFTNGMRYIGCRSCSTEPEYDVLYLGSGSALPEKRDCIKTIIGIYETRAEARNAEISFIKENDCVNSTSYYNLRLATYDKYGIPCNVDVLKGRTKENTEYIRQANVKRSFYRGNNRTPAQVAHDKRMRGVSTGPNPAKARKGTDNHGFTPWYSISPDGVVTQYFDKTKQEMAESFGVTPRQLGHRFHHTNIHRPAKTTPLKGWVFGNIDTDSE